MPRHNRASPTHLGGLLDTTGELLEQLQEREEALEDDAVRNVQSTQLQQEDRLHQHYNQSRTGAGLKANEGNVSYKSMQFITVDMFFSS